MERAGERGEPPPLPPLDFNFDEFEHGFLVRPGAAEGNVAKTSLWPNGLFAGDERSCRFEWRVPMDDETTLNMAWFFDRAAPGTSETSTGAVRYWYAPTREEESGEAIRTHQLNKKFAIWLNQAPIVDRTKEHLSEGDEGVVMLRNKLFSQISLIQDGGEPKALIYDPAQNQKLRLPETRSVFADTAPEGEIAFPYLSGQPEDVAEAYRRVIESWREQAGDA
jgi:5,5'-dehydrodivanillate O-demethylase